MRGEAVAAAADLERASCVFSNVREGFEGVVGVHVSCADSNIARSRLSVGVLGAAALEAVVGTRGRTLSCRGVEGVTGATGTQARAFAAAWRSVSGYSQKYRNSRHFTLR